MTGSAVPTHEQLDACFQAVEARCIERALVPIRLDGAPNGYLGVQFQGVTRKWDLYVDCDETALKLPHLWLGVPRPLLAHVGYCGTVCVNDGQGLSLDPDRHADIVAHTVLAGYDLLERSTVDAAMGMTEFFNELEGYWSGLPNSCRGRTAFEIDGKDRLVTAYANFKVKPPSWYFTERDKPAPSEFSLENLHRNAPSTSTWKSYRFLQSIRTNWYQAMLKLSERSSRSHKWSFGQNCLVHLRMAPNC